MRSKIYAAAILAAALTAVAGLTAVNAISMPTKAQDLVYLPKLKLGADVFVSPDQAVHKSGTGGISLLSPHGSNYIRVVLTQKGVEFKALKFSYPKSVATQQQLPNGRGITWTITHPPVSFRADFFATLMGPAGKSCPTVAFTVKHTKTSKAAYLTTTKLWCFNQL